MSSFPVAVDFDVHHDATSTAKRKGLACAGEQMTLRESRSADHDGWSACWRDTADINI